jgi:uncharacterized protein (TIGR03083 family)
VIDPVEVAAHIDALRSEGERMAVVAATSDLHAGVPSCPQWTVRDLVEHTGTVHRWALGYVRDGRTEPSNAELDESVATWPADELAGWLGQGCADLVAALVAAPDDLQCWTFLPAPSPRAMWARRQAHETAIHRVDMELSVGAAPSVGAEMTPFDPSFAADGVDELLTLFVPRRRTKLRADPPTSLAVRCTDIDASWLLRLDSQGVTTTSTTGTDDARTAACTVRATSGDLYLALWNRAGADDLTIEGDRDVLGQFSESVRII